VDQDTSGRHARGTEPKWFLPDSLARWSTTLLGVRTPERLGCLRDLMPEAGVGKATVNLSIRLKHDLTIQDVAHMSRRGSPVGTARLCSACGRSVALWNVWIFSERCSAPDGPPNPNLIPPRGSSTRHPPADSRQAQGRVAGSPARVCQCARLLHCSILPRPVDMICYASHR
jgi:hypothetical protein